MEFYETVNRRRSIRQFTDAPIAREVLERVLEAGLAAPSSDHQRRWELVVLADRDRIHEQVGGWENESDPQVVTEHVRRIRRKLAEAGSTQDPIETVWGLGYRWRA